MRQHIIIAGLTAGLFAGLDGLTTVNLSSPPPAPEPEPAPRTPRAQGTGAGAQRAAARSAAQAEWVKTTYGAKEEG